MEAVVDALIKERLEDIIKNALKDTRELSKHIEDIISGKYGSENLSYTEWYLPILLLMFIDPNFNK